MAMVAPPFHELVYLTCCNMLSLTCSALLLTVLILRRLWGGLLVNCYDEKLHFKDVRGNLTLLAANRVKVGFYIYGVA